MRSGFRALLYSSAPGDPRHGRGSRNRRLSPPVPRPTRPLPSLVVTTYHVLAAIGDAAEDHLSLGVFEAESARVALDRCLADHERELELEGVPPDLAEV